MNGLEIIFGIAILILSVIVHEVSHGYAAEAQGDPTARLAGRLTLNPVSHIDVVGSIIVPTLTFMLGGFIFGWAKPVPFNPYNLKNQRWGEAIVAVAGPASNIALAIIFGLVLRFVPLGGTAGGVISYVVLINLVLAIFNLVPIPPLDGSKILFAILPHHYQKVRFVLERYGLIVVLFFVVFFWKLIIPIISLLFTLITGVAFF